MTDTRPNRGVLITAWAAVLIIGLFRTVMQEVLHRPVSFEQQSATAAAVVVAGFALTFLWPKVRPLRPFFGLFLVLVGAHWLVYNWVDELPFYRSWLRNPSFNVYMLAEQSLNLMVTLIIIGFLYLLKRRRERFFLARGDTAAMVEPTPWLKVGPGLRWSAFGRILAILISLGTLAFLIIAGRPPLDIVVRALPFLPAVLLAAALNAFNEEVTYKASFLSVLEEPVGKRQSLLLMAAYFGLLHYYGVPYGVVGVLMAGLLGWLLGKSMLETRGLFWAWFIHLIQDVLIFSFLAIGSITPGG